jgi:hypothetical protein
MASRAKKSATIDAKLSRFEGEEVVQSRIEIPGAAGGLQDSLAFDPIEIHRGDIVYVVFRLRCDKVRHEPIKKVTGLRRVQILTPVDDQGNAGAGAMFVDADFVENKLAEHNEIVRIAKEQKAGVFRLGADDPAVGDGDGSSDGEDESGAAEG